MPGLRLALALHGSGSHAGFAREAFRADDLGVDHVVAVDDRTGDVGALRREIDSQLEQARASGDRVSLVAGISLGAHAVALWAAQRAQPDPEVDALLLALPAWTGAGGQVARATLAAADEVADAGSAAVLGRLEREAPHDWVVQALLDSWPRYGDEALVGALRAAGVGSGPTPEQLGRIGVPCSVVALDDDPLHPREVAEEWARTIPRARLEVLPRDLGGRGPREIGRAGAECLRRAAADARPSGSR